MHSMSEAVRGHRWGAAACGRGGSGPGGRDVCPRPVSALRRALLVRVTVTPRLSPGDAQPRAQARVPSCSCLAWGSTPACPFPAGPARCGVFGCFSAVLTVRQKGRMTSPKQTDTLLVWGGSVVRFDSCDSGGCIGESTALRGKAALAKLLAHQLAWGSGIPHTDAQPS